MKKSTILSFSNSSLLMMVLIVMAFDVSAHSGHDHHHWMSGFYHVLGLFSIISLSALLCYLFKTSQIKRKKTTRG